MSGLGECSHGKKEEVFSVQPRFPLWSREKDRQICLLFSDIAHILQVCLINACSLWRSCLMAYGRERHLFNQQLPLTVPQLGGSCLFYPQMVPLRDMSLIEIQRPFSKNSARYSSKKKDEVKSVQVLSLSLRPLDCSLVLNLFEEPLLLSEHIHLELNWCHFPRRSSRWRSLCRRQAFSLADDRYGLLVLVIKTQACSHQPTLHRHSGDYILDPHQLWLPLLRCVEMSHFTYPNISPHIKQVLH